MDKFLFLLPYFIAITKSLGVLVYTWRFHNVREAKAYAWYVAGQFFNSSGSHFDPGVVNVFLELVEWDKI